MTNEWWPVTPSRRPVSRQLMACIPEPYIVCKHGVINPKCSNFFQK